MSKFANFSYPFVFGEPVGSDPNGISPRIRLSGLSCGVVFVMIYLAIMIQRRLVTDTEIWTDGKTDTLTHRAIAHTALAKSRAVNNSSALSELRTLVHTVT